MSADTKSFRRVLFGALARAELPTPPDAHLAARFAEFITSANKLAWEFFQWPEIMRLETESVIAHPTMAGARYIPRTTDARHIHQLASAHTTNPLTDPCSQSVGFIERADGFYLPPSSPHATSTLWLHYRPAAPEFTSTLHVASSAYSKGSLVWEGNTAGDGHVFRALQSVPADTALTSTAHWVPVPIYSRLAEAVMAGAVGAHNASEGNYGSARVKVEYMLDLIEHEITLLTS